MTSFLVRHASAVDPHGWAGEDRLRPLDALGRGQAAELVELFERLEVRRIVSSPYARCVETVEPLAAARRLPVEVDERLAEGAGETAYALVQEDGIVCCTHEDVVAELLGRGLKKGGAVVLHAGTVVREI